MDNLQVLACGALLTSCASITEPTAPPLVAGGPTPHTRASADTPAPQATIDDLTFLAGRWVGEAFGGVVEETWNPPLGGVMLGTFRLISGGEPSFCELMMLVEHEGRLQLRLKHFNADFSPWEEGAETVDFPLVAIDGTTAYFGGLTLHRDGDHLLGYLSMRQGEELNEVEFRFERAR